LWSTSYAAIDRDDEYLWYAHVWLNDWPNKENHPEIFFVPSKTVVDCMKECRENNETWPYFWMTKEKAQEYKGLLRLHMLCDALGNHDM
jgi:phenolic acid decarboxylase